MGTIGELADGFPNLSCVVPAENAISSEMLREQGYNKKAEQVPKAGRTDR